MMITFSFDDNEVKADEPLGSVFISQGNMQLAAKTVFLDSFFAALVTAYQQSSTGPSTIQVAEENETLELIREGTGLKVRYGEQEINLPDANEFERSLRSSSTALLSAFREGTLHNNVFDPVRAFVAGPRQA